MKRLLGLLFLLCSLSLQAGNYARLYRNLPATLSEPRAPRIPSRRVALTDFGAVGDGVTDNTEAFRRAIAALSKKGGHLDVPAGIFLTGPIVLESRIDLHLERGAVIMMTPDRAAFWDKDSTKMVPGISADDCTDISITGEGTIDGNGRWWRAVKRNKVSDEEWKAFRRMGGTVADCGKLWYPYDLDHADNVAEGYKAQEKLRTHLIRLTDCERVLVGGVTLQNAPKFHLVPQRCRQVIIDGVTVRCPWNAQNGDGIDLMQSKDVLVTRCTVDVGDDGICLKAGAGQAALEAGPTARVLVCDNTVYHAHGGFVIGSEFSGGMEDIVVVRNLFSGTDTGLRFKSGSGRGGKTSNIFVSDIVMTDISGEAIIFETTYVNVSVGEAGDHDFSGTFLPDFSGIRIKNVTCREARTAISAHGDPSTIHDNLVEDSVFFYSEKGLDADDPGMVTLRGVKLQTY